jgi:hypothetical protein
MTHFGQALTHVDGAIYRTVPLPLAARIFSWPWRPFTKEYRIRDYSAEAYRDWQIKEAAKRAMKERQ